MKYDASDFLIEQIFPSGAWNIHYRTPAGELIKMKYFGFTREESVSKFEDMLKELK